MQKVNVSLGERSYSILIGKGLLPSLGSHYMRLGLGPRCAVISDRKVAPRYAGVVLNSLKKVGVDPVLITVPAGEGTKSLRNLEFCYDQLAKHRLERKSSILALGGGVVGDLAGFVAATYLRGIPFVQIPTTLLAQVDSSVGGKTGINLKAGKNLVGAFYQPRLVICDLDTLDTLPLREFRAGLAEIIKYGIIQDAALFRLLEREMGMILKRDATLLTRIIARSCSIKADVVSQDETETSLRAILNFGHTVGHAIEASTGYGTYLHGEAIAIGQVLASILSIHLLDLPVAEAQRIADLFHAAGLPTSICLTPAKRTRLLHAMKLDKKVSGGEIKFVLAEKIGRVKWGQKVPLSLLNDVLTPYCG